MPTPLQAMMLNIARWEGLYQAHPNDPGNWANGVCVGTMRGVTPAVLAAHRGVSVASITPAIMKSVSLAEAAEIGLARFYHGQIDPLRWTACADVVTDFGWGSGPGQAVLSTERDFLGLPGADYRFDARSVAAWSNELASAGAIKMVWRYYDIRERFYDLICRRNAALQPFRQGWHNRAAWMTPVANSEWWAHWRGEDTAAAVTVADAQPSDPMPSALLSQGSFGADVRTVQEALIRAGYALPRSIRADGSPDGVFGVEMDEVVRRFQADRKLDVDGWVGPLTRRALFGAGRFFG